MNIEQQLPTEEGKIVINEQKIEELKRIRRIGLVTYKEMTYMSRSQLHELSLVIQKAFDEKRITHALYDNYDQARIELGFEPREVRSNDYMFPWEEKFNDIVFTDDGVTYRMNNCTWRCPQCRQYCTPEHGCPDCDEWPTGLVGKTIEVPTYTREQIPFTAVP